jgi:general stress protein YciG
MPWVRFEDTYPRHRKIRRLTDAEYRLHNEAIIWSAAAENLTDGQIPHDELDDVTYVKNPLKHVPVLIARGLWHAAGHGCDRCPQPVDPDGWVLHDYLHYQPSRADVMADRERKREAGRRGGLASGVTRRAASERPEAQGKQTVKQAAKRAAKQNGLADAEAPAEAPLLNTRPVPSRPDPKNASGGDPGGKPPGRDDITAGAIVGAYVDGAVAAGHPKPAEQLRARVGRQARRMLAEPDADPALLRDAATEMGRQGWNDLAVQVQRMSAGRSRDRPAAAHAAFQNPPVDAYREPL